MAPASVSHAATEPTRRTKRADGEGGIRKRGDGTFEARLMVGHKPDGTPDRRSVYGKTEKECQRKLQALRQQHSQGTVPTARDTLAGYVARFLDATRASVRPTTHQRYEQLLRLHVLPTLGTKRLDALRPDDVQRLYAALLTKVVDRGQGRRKGAGKVLSPRTVRHVHIVLHTALEQAVKWGYLPRNVCDAVEAPQAHRLELHPPTAAEVARFLDANQDDPLLPLWTVAAYSGARQGELLGLHWADLDLDAGTMTIARTLLQTSTGGQPAYAPPKTAKSRRTIVLPPDAVEELRAHRQRQIERRVLLGPDYGYPELVFASAVGTPLGHRNILRSFKAALARADLPTTIRFHDLRHAAATNMRAAGIELKTVSERLGHATLAITADLYTHGVAGADADAARTLQALIRGQRQAR